MKRLVVWSVLFGISLVVHVTISWRIGQDIDNPPDPVQEVEIHIAVVEPPPEPLERPEPEDALEFEEEF